MTLTEFNTSLNSCSHCSHWGVALQPNYQWNPGMRRVDVWCPKCRRGLHAASLETARDTWNKDNPIKTSNSLLPTCPQCNVSTALAIKTATGFFYIFCPNCNQYGKAAPSDQGAIDLWNAQFPPSTITPSVTACSGSCSGSCASGSTCNGSGCDKEDEDSEDLLKNGTCSNCSRGCLLLNLYYCDKDKSDHVGSGSCSWWSEKGKPHKRGLWDDIE